MDDNERASKKKKDNNSMQYVKKIDSELNL